MFHSLKDLDLKNVYSSTRDNLLDDFYNPVLENAVEYDRITGFFSPKVLALAARGMSRMILGGGKIRILTSVKLDPEIYEAVTNIDSLVENYDWSNFDEYELEDELERDYLKLFLVLLKNGVLELRVALAPGDVGILHEKIGIIKGHDGMSLSFSGSNNETIYGWTKNIEQFKVFPEWDSSLSDYYKDDKEKFEEYWSNNNSSVRVLTIDEAFKDKVLKVSVARDDVETLIAHIKEKEGDRLSRLTPSKPSRSLRNYQEEAISQWVNHGYKYILEMATGSGKTFTSLNALRRFKDNEGFIRCIIVVPLLTLVEQWEAEINSLLDFTSVIIAAGTNTSWRSDIRQISQTSKLGNDSDFVVITTYSTFSTQDFRDLIGAFPKDDMILLADEMHNLVTENNITSASSAKFRYKLGLSATPTRLWKPEESGIVRSIFGGESYVYSLADAIRDKALVEYVYKTIPIHLTEEEYEEYELLSREASRMSHYANDNKVSNSLARMLTRRAIIKKQAENKFVALEQLIDKLRKTGTFNHSLVYVDSNESLVKVQKIFTDKFIKSSKFTGSESSDVRNSVMKALDQEQIEAIVAIKCLDEGVDIPSAKNGIFLSNNTDPREYVQRLGRVLRRHDQSNKEVANVYDFLVLPPKAIAATSSTARNLVKSEIIRAKFFEELARNSEEVSFEIGKMLDIYGYYFEQEELMRYNTSENESYEQA